MNHLPSSYSAKDTTVRVWSRATLSLVATLQGHTGPVNAIDLSPTSNRIISASGDGTLILWDIPTQKLTRTFSGHSRGLACVAFVPPPPPPPFARTQSSSSEENDDETQPIEDELVVSGSNDKTIRVWRASTGECISLLEGHEGLVRALAYDRVTGRLVSASYDRSVILWQLTRTPPSPPASSSSPTNHASSSTSASASPVPISSSNDGDVDGDGDVSISGDGLLGVSAKQLRVFKGNHSSHIFDVKFDLTRIIRSVSLNLFSSGLLT